MALTEKDKKQLMFIVIVLALGAAVGYFMLWWQPQGVDVTTANARADSIQLRVDSAKQDLARGTVQSLRQRVADYQAQLVLMRQLVPTGNELPSLLNDISARAKLRGVGITDFDPMNVEEAGEFQAYRYRFKVTGHYDQLGEFLSDIASLRRILVPYDVTVSPSTSPGAAVSADTTGALLDVTFQLRTFVKPETVDSTRASAAGGASHVP
jgi:type IV pilus assembly protein PilO